MTYKEVIELLATNKNQRGIDNWDRTGFKGLKSWGIGLTQIRKLAKKVERNHNLAFELWKSDYFDARQMACLIEEYKKVTEAQIDLQVKSINFWLLSHTYIGDLVAKTQYAQKKADQWIAEQDNLLLRCGFLLLYWLAKDNKKLPDSYFEAYFYQIKNLQQEENFVKDAMNNALLSIGKRNKSLHGQALDIASANGTVNVDYGDNSCQAVDVVKHLTSDYVTNKFEL